MGDVLHTLPALTDAAQALSNIEFHWVVEESFAEIPKWHQQVTKVIPVALRRWRKNVFKLFFNAEWRAFKRSLQAENYDAIIDAQGLLKSAWLTRYARGIKHGLSYHSAREPLASLCYNKTHVVKPQQHAVARVRQLFAQALGYAVPISKPNYTIDVSQLPALSFVLPDTYTVCLHGTTWATKHYPEAYWQTLISSLVAKQHAIVLPWGNATELQRAKRLAAQHATVSILPQCSLAEIATVLANAEQVITVDTGLSHLSAALDKKTIGLYGPTDPKLTGTEGANQIHLGATAPACAPCLQRKCTYQGPALQQPACFDSINPDRILQHIN